MINNNNLRFRIKKSNKMILFQIGKLQFKEINKHKQQKTYKKQNKFYNNIKKMNKNYKFFQILNVRTKK